MRTRLRLGSVAVVAVVTLAMSGCTNSAGDPKPAPGSSMATSPSPTATAAPASQADVTELLPAFHEELHRLVVDESEPSMVVMSARRDGEPRDVTIQLLAVDRGAYAVADETTIPCGFLEEVHLDEDGPALFFSCTGGASAHYAYAFVPVGLDLGEHPHPDAEGEVSGWLHAGWSPEPSPGVDGLTLHLKTCVPSCVDGGLQSYVLVWDEFIFEAVSCVTDDGREAALDFNASAFPVLSSYGDGCPAPVTEPR